MGLIRTVKVKGSQGSWLVTVKLKGETQMPPTAHKEFLRGMLYVRKDGEMAKREGKYKKWLDALLKTKMVVLTDDTWVGEPGTEGSKVKRTHYIGVFAITDINFPRITSGIHFA